MSIQQSLRYDLKNDCIFGFHDVGHCDDNETPKDAANSLLVFMAKGIKHSWRQPIGYYPVRNGVSSTVLQNMVIRMMYDLHKVGLNVVCVICDFDIRQVSCFTDRLHVTSDKPFFYHPISCQKVFVVFDPPHIIKCLRNNFINYKIQVSYKIQ